MKPLRLFHPQLPLRCLARGHLRLGQAIIWLLATLAASAIYIPGSQSP